MTLLVVLGFVVIATILGAVYLSLKSTRDDDEIPARGYGSKAGRGGITRAGGTRMGGHGSRAGRPAVSPSLADLVQSEPGDSGIPGRPGRRAADAPGPRSYPAARRSGDGHRPGRPQRPRLRMGRGRQDDDPWPAAGDDLSDEQFWAELSSGGPDAGTARFPGPDAGTARFPGPDAGTARFPGPDAGTARFPGPDVPAGDLPPAAQRGPGPASQERRGRDEPMRSRQPADSDPFAGASSLQHGGFSRRGGGAPGAPGPYSPRGQQPPPPGGRDPSMAETQALRRDTEGPGTPAGPGAAPPGGRRGPGRHSGGYRDGAYANGDARSYYGDAPAHGNGYSPAGPYPDPGYENAPGGHEFRGRDGWRAPPPDDGFPYSRQPYEDTGTRRRDRPYRGRYDRTDRDSRY